MPISDYNRDFIPRMTDPNALTEDEICGMVPWLSKTPVGIDGILGMRLAFQQMRVLLETRQTIENFDQASRKLTRWLIGLTGVLVVLTIVIAWFTIELAKKH